MNPIKVFSGNSNPEFAKKVTDFLGIPLGKAQVGRFSDGEVQVEIQESVRGHNVFVIQSTCPPVNEYCMELVVILDALKRSSCKEITAVLPYYGYARQDRKAAPRAPISAKAVSKILEVSGAQRILTVDLHSHQIQGFFSGPVDHLFATKTLAKKWAEEHGKDQDCVAISPDSGGVERTRAFAKEIKSPLAIIDKRRQGPNRAQAFNVIGDVGGKRAIIVDDMIDTAGTLTAGIESILEKGAREVYALATHAVFSGSAVEKINKSELKEVWVTDTIPLSKEASACSKIKVVSIAHLVAEAIKRVNDFKSVSELFNDKR